MGSIIQVTLGGLATGCLTACVLLGGLLTYHVSKVMNFGHGQYGMIAVFISYNLYLHDYTSFWISVLIGVFIAVMLGMASEKFLIEQIRGGTSGNDLVLTLGLFVALTTVAEQFLGNSTYRYNNFIGDDYFMMGAVKITMSDIVVIAITVAAVLAVYWLLLKTSIGIQIRAIAENEMVAVTTGININRVKVLVWGLSGFLSSVAALMIASRLAMNTSYVTPFLLNAFVAGIIGGLTRLWTPLILAVALGVIQNWTAYFIGAEYQKAVIFVITVLALSLTPKKYLSEESEGRP